jgi:hypothetical protein
MTGGQPADSLGFVEYYPQFFHTFLAEVDDQTTA